MNGVYDEYDNLSVDDLERIYGDLQFNLENTRNTIMEEKLKYEKYKVIICIIILYI
jgi:hypothetical protein